MDFSRLRNGEIVAAVGGIALFIFMFFDWFGGGVEISTSGTQNVPGIGEIPNSPSVEETGVSAWDALADFSGFLIALAAVSGVALGGLAASGQRFNLGGVPRGAGTAGLGSLAVLLILWRFFANPGDLKIGIFLGLVAAIAVAVGALVALREEGFEPLVKVPGGRTKVASASAPAATPTPRPATAPSGGSSSGGSAATKSRASGSAAKKTRSSGSAAAKPRASGSTAKKTRSSGSAAAKPRASGSTAKKSRSGGSNAKKSRSGARKSTAKRSTASRAKSSGSPRSKSSGSSRSKTSGSSARSKSSATRKRSSGGRK